MTILNNRTDIINFLALIYHKKRYLEIGIHNAINFNSIICEEKEGVDPYSGNAKFRMTSDKFFETITPDIKYDLIFIDGDHNEEIVDRDIKNSLNHINKNGIIILHDCNPITEMHESLRVSGTVWKSWAKLRMICQDLEMYVIDCDCGCGIIKLGQQMLIQKIENLNYEILKNDRKQILNLITIEDFIKKEFNNALVCKK